MHLRRVCWVILIILLGVASPALRADATAGDIEFFETRVRPVLAEHCYQCHSADAPKLKAGLRLDSSAGIFAGGESGAVISPGDPAASRLLQAIRYDHPDLQMPPKGKLSDRQIADIAAWIKMGAPAPAEAPLKAAAKPSGFDLYQRKRDHWAWQPVRVMPAAPIKNAPWPADPLDNYVLARLEQAHLSPAPPTDKRTWLRRATFDLIGLPPTPAEVRAFLEDESSEAYAKVVDRLLGSPHFGERWARHWMDLVRYAETRGHEFDYEIPGAYQYRDYLIRALNADVPYDQFVREHIAGDLIPTPRRDDANDVNESIIGTGFWFFGEWLHSPVDIAQDEADRVDNQIDVLGKAFLGLTISCARCHDHKFDAISTKDYYSLVGFLHSGDYQDVQFQFQRHNAEAAKRLRQFNEARRPALLSEWASAQRPAIEESGRYLLAIGCKDDAGPNIDLATLTAWAQTVNFASNNPTDPLNLWAKLSLDADAQHPERFSAAVERLAKQALAPDVETASASAIKCVVDYGSATADDWITSGIAFGDAPLRAGAPLPTPGKSKDQEPLFSILDESAAHSAALGDALPGMVRTPTFVISEPKLWMRVAGSGQAFVVIDSHRLVRGPLHGVSNQSINSATEFIWKEVDLQAYIGQRAHVEFTAAADGWIAAAGVWQGAAPARDTPAQIVARRLLAAPPASWAELAQRYQALFVDAARSTAAGDPNGLAPIARWLVRNPSLFPVGSKESDAIKASVEAFKRERLAIQAELRPSPTAVAMLDGSGVDERVFLRGNHKTPGDLAPRRFLEALAGPEPLKNLHGSGRLELAEQIASADNPLTARVMANRIWHHLLGRGIVASTDNFGVLGDRPTHPELLDYLADRFVREGWSVKRLIRAIVLSSTYRMASVADAAADEADPGDLLLHRARVRRLEAEAIRDAMLAVSGRLDGALFGPSVEPHLTPFMQGRGRPADGGPLDGAGRRSIYLKVRRNFISPMMLAFDAPAPAGAMGRRSVSNVPAQALILLNDPFVVEEAGRWADKILQRQDCTAAQKVGQMYESAFARPATPAETVLACDFLDAQAQRLESDGKTPGEARRGAWVDLAHVLFNAKEFIFLN